MSDSSRPHGLQPTRLLRPWDFPGRSTGVGSHCHWQAGSLSLAPTRQALESEKPPVSAVGGGEVGGKGRGQRGRSSGGVATGGRGREETGTWTPEWGGAEGAGPRRRLPRPYLGRALPFWCSCSSRRRRR